MEIDQTCSRARASVRLQGPGSGYPAPQLHTRVFSLMSASGPPHATPRPLRNYLWL